jgi:hypothetical protein
MQSRNFNFVDIAGQRFGRLVVTEFSGIVNGRAHWVCLCDCGKTEIINGKNLRRGLTKSCGCLQSERARANVLTHNKHDSKVYHVYYGMKSRCLNTNNAAYNRYGGRGIVICDRWLESFENFYADMGDCPDGCSIDRIDNDAGYSPDNCRWVTVDIQNRNTRQNHMITYDGRTMCLADWAKEIGIDRATLYARISVHGWSANKALTTPLAPSNRKPSK